MKTDELTITGLIFSGGGTSWSKFNADVPTVSWKYWELAKD